MGSFYIEFCNTFTGDQKMSTEVIISGAFVVVAILFVGAIFTVLELDKTKKEEKNKTKK